MTSARGQNVSVLQLHGNDPLEPSFVAGRSPRLNSFKINGNAYTNGKVSSQHSFGSSTTTSRNSTEGYSSKSSTVYVLNSGSSSCSVNRELSPVRWCDREVDGVYLGRAGWVQVQQRSLDDSKGTLPTVRTRKYLSNFKSNSDSLDRREPNRPVNLPLPSKSRTNTESHKMPSAFIHEFESVPAPSMTPILSPPPAFRDEGIDIELPLMSTRKSFYFQESIQSPNVADSQTPVALGTKLSPVSAMKHHSYRFSQTKSLDENSLERRTRNGGHFASPVSLFGFRSLDNDSREISENDFYIKSFENSCEEDDGDENRKHYAVLPHCGQPNSQRDTPKTFRQRKYQLNGKQVNAYRTRSPSLDSNSSSSSGGSSDDDRNHKISSRRFATKQLENGGKHFNVKRSRSLQLAEERPPRELMLMSHSSSGKSWDCKFSPECATLQTKNENNRHQSQSLRNLHNVMVTVNGQSIPVISPGDQSINLLSKITASEEEQKKLIREAEKEARVISEYLNGTRSRAAARNLLMHRYFNRSEVPASDLNEPIVNSKTEFEPRFLPSAQRYQYKQTSWNEIRGRDSFHDERDYGEPVYAKTLPRSHNGISPVETMQDQMGRKKRDNSVQKRKQQPLLQTCLLSSADKPPFTIPNQRQRSKVTKKRSFEKLERHIPGANGTKSQTYNGTHSRNRVETYDNSSTSSSSSDIHEMATNAHRISSTSDLSADCICLESTPFASDENAKKFFHCRSASAPETEDCNGVGNDQRSLSLPRSFLSEQYRLNYFSRRNSFPWRHQRIDSLSGEDVDEWAEKLSGSRTVPTTPIRDSRDERSTKTLNRYQRHKSSCVTLPDESDLIKPQYVKPKIVDKAKQKKSCDSISTSVYNDRNLKLADHLSETGSLNFRNSSLKLVKGKEISRGSHRGITGRGNDEENDLVVSVQGDLMFDLPPIDSSNEKARTKLLRHPASASSLKKQRKLRNRAFTYDKYDSHDSGIQIGIRGNIDSSESQDTDLQEDVDSPLLGGIHWGIKKGVRRTKSDLGGLRLFSWDVRNRNQRFPSNTSSLRGSQTTALWRPLSPQDSALLQRCWRPQLRRSLSLNELAPLVKAKSPTAKRFTLSEDEKNVLGGNSEDELLSGSESSIASLSDRKKPYGMEQKEDAVIYAEALWDHVAMESFELPFRAGDVIEVLDNRDRDWWWGATEDCCGYFPSAFVRLRVSQENAVGDCFSAVAPTAFDISEKLRRGKSFSLLSTEQIRSSVVRELLNTEREFVKILRDIKDGYITQCCRRIDMFSPEQIRTIFSNLEEIFAFQKDFLKDLESRLDQEFPHKSCLGEVFLNHSCGFRMYSEYCNSHPMAIATLQELYQKNNYCKFFEMCRLKQNLSEIPLDGYLLTPVQRICKYPLQLAELLKYTKPDHADFAKVEEALETMRSVATLINERKRKMESLEKLASWQERVEGWEGEDLIESSSRLIYQGDVVRITSGMWTTNITLFLFDHQIIYCKKDLLKRNNHIYKGRIHLDESEVMDLPDGKNQQLGVAVKYGIKVSDRTKEKWLVFCCRSSEDKGRWLEALAEEKKVVAQDKDGGLDLPPTAKQLAKMAARTKKVIPSKPRGKNKMATGTSNDEMSYRHAGGHMRSSPKVKGSRRMGTWFTFGGVMKSPKVSLKQRNSLQQMT